VCTLKEIRVGTIGNIFKKAGRPAFWPTSFSKAFLKFLKKPLVSRLVGRPVAQP
jgi:hypothetical protein